MASTTVESGNVNVARGAHSNNNGRSNNDVALHSETPVNFDSQTGGGI